MNKYITIGRSSHCDIIIPNESVSREHARISVSGGNYVFDNMGKNGSVLGGRQLPTGKSIISPGAQVLLAGRVPLPWAQIYTMLPIRGTRPYQEETHYEGGGASVAVAHDYSNYQSNKSIGVGWGILAFLIPLAGWIMYFCWKDETPKRASQASTLAWIGFGLNVLSILGTL